MLSSKKAMWAIVILLTLIATCSFGASNPKSIAIGKSVTVIGIVTVSYNDVVAGKNYTYIEQSDRSQGIAIEIGGYASGTCLAVHGVVGLKNSGELVIVPASYNDVTALGTGFPISRPLFISQKNLGNELLDYQSMGLLVRISGRVTQATPGGMMTVGTVYLDDGSKRKNDVEGLYGTKVYSNSSNHYVGEYTSMTGVVSLESFSNGTKMPVIYEGQGLAYPSHESTKATIAITISSGASASGKQAEIGSENAACQIALNSTGSGSGQIRLPLGDYAISCCIPGFVTETKLVTVAEGSSVNFNLSAAKTFVDVLPASMKVVPGQSTAIKIVVRDEMGNKIANIPLTWYTSLGTIVSPGLVTDQKGEALAVLQTTTKHSVYTVRVTATGVSGVAWVDVTEPGDPYVRILRPEDGVTVSGNVTAYYDVYDTNSDGTSDIWKQEILLDNEVVGSFAQSDAEALGGFDTTPFDNGWHIFKARVTDKAGNIIDSNEVRLYFDNQVSGLRISQQNLMIDKNPIPFRIQCNYNRSDIWSVIITRKKTSEVVFESSGVGPGNIDVSWGGMVGGSYLPGLYEISLSSTASIGAETTTEVASTELIKEYIGISYDYSRALVMGVFGNDDKDSQNDTSLLIDAVCAGLDAAGIRYTVLCDPVWQSKRNDEEHMDKLWGTLKDGMEYWIGAHPSYKFLYFTGHGGQTYADSDNTMYRSVVLFADGISVTGDNWWWQGSPGASPAFTDCHLPYSQYKIVQFDVCWSAGTLLESDLSISEAFGVYDFSEESIFIGWRGMFRAATVPGLWAATPNGIGWTKGFWSRLASGQTAGSAIWNLTYFPKLWEKGLQKLNLKWNGSGEVWLQ